jgi:glycerol uptake facilitator-like aquaporin
VTNRHELKKRAAAECLGTALLLAAIVGSGIMAERLSGANLGVALLANAVATGTMLAVLIMIFAPLSGAHLNPAVTLAMLMRGEIAVTDALAYCLAQGGGAVAGVWAAHLMFGEPAMQLATHVRFGYAQFLSEGIATFGLLLTILACMRRPTGTLAAAVGLYITAAYWYTGSTGFANPAVTAARALTDSFSGIAAAGVPAFVIAQLLGAAVAVGTASWLFDLQVDAAVDGRSSTHADS